MVAVLAGARSTLALSDIRPNAAGMNHVFAIFVEITPEDGGELDKAGFGGPFGTCYVLATDEMNATRILFDDLTKRRLHLVNINWCVDHDSTDWETPIGVTQDRSVARARETGDVIYDTFHS